MKTLVSSTNSQFLYVSSSYAGSVSNGSITNPYKTIQAAINAAQNGATILLKKGDLFNINHSINLHDKHIHLNNYGSESESLPIISGFISVPTNVRRISNTNKWMMNVPASCTNIGFFYYRQTDSIAFGRRVVNQNGLERDGDFYQHNNVVIFYNEGAFFGYDQLEIAYSLSCFEYLSDCSVENIRIEGFGIHAFSGTSVNSSIRNVEIDLIGGCFQTASTRFGNGIEFWIPSLDNRPHDLMVAECTISRVYDAACTIQGEVVSNQCVLPAAYNIVFTNNIISNCRQSFECFVRQKTAAGIEVSENYPIQNCRFDNNICTDAGQNGFDSVEHRDCHLYGGTEGMQIKNNFFNGGGFLYRFYNQQHPQEFQMLSGNICVLRVNETVLKTYNRETGNYVENIVADENFSDRINTYRSVYPDITTEFSLI